VVTHRTSRGRCAIGKSAPEPPDPKQTSAASAATNVGTAIANANLGNVNQITPDGSLNYNQTGTYKWKDPYAGKTYDIPTYTATQTLSAANQAIKDQTDSAKLNAGKAVNDLSAQLPGIFSTPLDLSSGNIDQYINSHFDDDFNKTWDTNYTNLESSLANRGVRMGSDAYTKAIDDFSTQKSNAHDNLYGNNWDRAVTSYLTERNTPLNELTALLSGSQLTPPNYVSTNEPKIATTDVAGLINTNYQQKLAQWQQQQESMGGLFGGLMKLGTSFLL